MGGEVGFERDEGDHFRVGRQREIVESKVLDDEWVGGISPCRRCITHHSECNAVRECALEEIVEGIAGSSRGELECLHRHLGMRDDVVLVLFHQHIIVARHYFRPVLPELDEEARAHDVVVVEDLTTSNWC